MKKLYYSIFLSITVVSVVFGQQNNNRIRNLEIPKTYPADKIIKHTAYSLLFDEKNNVSVWVAYELSKDKTVKTVKRTNKFLPDPLVSSSTSFGKDYSGSGYDKGHLAPAADMGWSSITMAESFYYSNMTPQVPAFNRGIWKRLEEQVRTWAAEYDDIYVVTGPVLTEGMVTIGPDRIAVPKYFYKVILDYTYPDIKVIGFIIANSGSALPLKNFAVSIDSVEKISGIDFFPLLPDDQEKKIESELCIGCWSWNKNIQKQHSSISNNSSATVQCSAKTKSGTRCKHMTHSPNGKCFQHGGN